MHVDVYQKVESQSRHEEKFWKHVFDHFAHHGGWQTSSNTNGFGLLEPCLYKARMYYFLRNWDIVILFTFYLKHSFSGFITLFQT